jgi:hypothetical protein
MGTLKPGATYVYETPDGGNTVYARETGSNTRVLIGKSMKAQEIEAEQSESALWSEIRRVALTNPGLQSELDRVKMFYYLIKDQEPVMWHPV